MTKFAIIQKNEPASVGNRIKSLRMLAGYTRKNFSLKTQISENTLKTWEDPLSQNRKGLTQKGAERLIEAARNCGIECTLEWLIEGIGPGPSIIDSKFLPSSYEQITWGEEESIFRDIESFKKNNPNPIVVTINDGSFLPYYFYGDYVGGTKKTGEEIELLIGSICIIELSTKILVRKILNKNEQGKYTLTVLNNENSVTEEIMDDINIISAAKIVWHRSREFPKSIIA